VYSRHIYCNLHGKSPASKSPAEKTGPLQKKFGDHCFAGLKIKEPAGGKLNK